MTGIYKITSPTGKVYIGQSVNIKGRLSRYKTNNCKHQVKLHTSIFKHGFKKHSFEVIHELPKDISPVVLTAYEQLYIDLYRGCGVELMNIKEAGSNGKLSIETKRKISDALKGKPRPIPNAETRLKMAEAKRGKVGNRKGTIGLRGELNPLFGRKLPEDVILKMKATKKGMKLSDSHKAKLALRMMGDKNHNFKRVFSEETKDKIRNKRKLQVNTNAKPVLQFDTDNKLIAEWSSGRAASKALNIVKSGISNAVNGKIKTAGGFIWRYKTQAA